MIGQVLGPYRVLEKLGEGGMGVVYRARDTRLNRDIALKVLPDTFAADPDRLARFQREAELLASLNHPNIAAIYGIEETDGVRALILLVNGPTLADRIAKGPISIDGALPIARQIAEVLEAAHRQGVIHRDLKPANVKVRGDGTVKVLDFGLARLIESDMESSVGLAGRQGLAATNSPHLHVTGDDDGRRDSRDGRVHESRAGEGARGGQAQRRVGVRLRAVRDADRQTRVRRRRRQRYAGDCSERRTGVERVAGRRSRLGPRVDSPVPAERSGQEAQ